MCVKVCALSQGREGGVTAWTVPLPQTGSGRGVRLMPFYCTSCIQQVRTVFYRLPEPREGRREGEESVEFGGEG